MYVRLLIIFIPIYLPIEQRRSSLANPQQFVVSSLCYSEVDLVIAIDTSGSMGPNLNQVVDSAQYLASGFCIEDNSTRAAVIDFSAVSNVHKALDTNNTGDRVDEALEEIRRRPQNGETWPELALDRASDLFSKANPQKENSEKAMVVFSDGEWTSQERDGITVSGNVFFINPVSAKLIQVEISERFDGHIRPEPRTQPSNYVF